LQVLIEVKPVSRQQIIAQVKQATGMVVHTGPFSGMRLHDLQTWGAGEDIGSQLLGVYEQELYAALLGFVARRPTTVVNVGCAEGYYAIGLARLLPDACVHAFDIDPQAQEVCRANATLNGVADRVYVEGACSPARLYEIASRDANIVAVVDCEGAEKALLTDENSSAALKYANVVIETHDFHDRDILPALMRAFTSSHRLSVMYPGARNPHAFPFLDEYSDADKWLLVCENRPERQSWLICERQQEPPSASHGEASRNMRGQPARTPTPGIPKRPCITNLDIDARGLLRPFPHPLICTVVYGSDIHYACLNLLLESLIKFGKYDGKIAILSDRTIDFTLEHVPNQMRSQILHFSLNDASLAGRYTVADYDDLSLYSPILYVDNDIIIDKDITPILQAISNQEGICVTTEAETYPELASDKVSDIQDVRGIGNWFGLDLIRADPSCSDEFLPIANSGIIGVRDYKNFSLIADLIRNLYRHPVHSEYAKWFGDQPFLNYVLLKTRLGVYDILSKSCSFLGSGSTFPIKRCGFAHFIWARGEDKHRMMGSYLRHLRIETAPTEVVQSDRVDLGAK
jgi:hypothetical protein